jgi:dGTPase
VRIVDRVAYINHDIDDAIRFGLLSAGELPREEIEILGPKGSRRIDTLVHDLVESSAAAGDIVQSDEVGGAMLSLRAFMFDHVYLGPHTRAEHERARATVRTIFEHLAAHGDDADAIADYLSGMTDRFALEFVAQS